MYTVTDLIAYFNFDFNDSPFVILKVRDQHHLILLKDYQLSLSDFNQRFSRSQTLCTKDTSNHSLPKPVRSVVLLKPDYHQMKQKLLTLHTRFLQNKSFPDELNTISKRISSLSRKHRIFRSRAEWQRLQNLRYLVKLLRARIYGRIHLQTSPSDLTPSFAEIYDPTELDENHDELDSSFHQPED